MGLKFQYRALLFLAYQSLGFMFGDLTLSPLYVYQSIFSGRLKKVQNEDAIFGAFSLIFWTLSIISLLKYAIIMLSADDNGEGQGYFSLLFCKIRSFIFFSCYYNYCGNANTFNFYRGNRCFVFTPLQKCKILFAS